MSIRTLAFASLAALASLSGCSMELGSSTPGDEGQVRFSYSSCLFGCAVDHPILAGSTTRLSVEGAGARALWAVSSSPDVTVHTSHAYSCCKSSGSSSTCTSAKEDHACDAGWTVSLSQAIQVTTRAAGTARISLTDAKGAYVDAITVTIADPAQVVLKANDEATDAVELKVGGALTLALEARDASGQLLEAENGLSLLVKDKSIAAFDDASWVMADPEGVNSVNLGGWLTRSDLRGRKPGSTTLTLRAGRYARDVVVTVK